LGDRIDVLLAVAPAFLHILQGHVGWQPGGDGADGGRRFFRVTEVGPREREHAEQPVDVDPARVAVVISEGELVVLAGKGEALDDPEAPVNARDPAAMVFNALGDDLPAERGATGLEPAEQRWIRRGTQGVDVVRDQGAQLRTNGEEPGERAVFEEVGDLEPMADGMQALFRTVLRVVRAFADRAELASFFSASAAARLRKAASRTAYFVDP
jgi:hypothetical protein